MFDRTHDRLEVEQQPPATVVAANGKAKTKRKTVNKLV
jgi:hypothetical protein